MSLNHIYVIRQHEIWKYFLLCNNISKQNTSLCACEHFTVSVLLFPSHKSLFEDKVGSTLYVFSFISSVVFGFYLKLNTWLAFSPAYCSEWNTPLPFCSCEPFRPFSDPWKRVAEEAALACSAVLARKTRRWWQCRTKKKNQYLCLCVCPQETFILSSEDMKRFFETHRVGRVHFSLALQESWCSYLSRRQNCCDGWCCRGNRRAQRKTLGKIFYLFCHGV